MSPHIQLTTYYLQILTQPHHKNAVSHQLYVYASTHEKLSNASGTIYVKLVSHCILVVRRKQCGCTCLCMCLRRVCILCKYVSYVCVRCMYVMYVCILCMLCMYVCLCTLIPIALTRVGSLFLHTHVHSIHTSA